MCVCVFPDALVCILHWLQNRSKQPCLTQCDRSPLQQAGSSSHLGPFLCHRQNFLLPNLYFKQVQEISKQQGWVKKIGNLLFSMYSLNRVRKYCYFHFIRLFFGGTTFFFLFLFLFNKVRNTLSGGCPQLSLTDRWPAQTHNKGSVVMVPILFHEIFFGINWRKHFVQLKVFFFLPVVFAKVNVSITWGKYTLPLVADLAHFSFPKDTWISVTRVS